MKNSKAEGFFSGVLALMFSQIAVKLLGMIYSLYLTNKNGFGDSGNAICMSAYQIYAIFLTISSIGIPNSVSKIVAENFSVGDVKGAKRVFKVAIAIFALVGLSCSLILYFSSDFIAKYFLQIDAASDTLKILAPSIFFVSVTSVIRGYFNGKQNIKVSAIIQTFEQLIKTILTIVMVEFVAKVTRFNTELMAKTSMLSATLATIFSFIYVVKKYIETEKKDCIEIKLSIYRMKPTIKQIMKEILMISIPISISFFVTSLGNNIDSFTIIRLLKNKLGEELAREKYGILSSKVELLTTMPLALNGALAVALVPEIAKLNSLNDEKELNKKVNLSFLITFFIAIPIMLGMNIYSNEIINFLYPNANRGGELLKIATMSIIFTSLTQTMTGILQGVGKLTIHLKIMSVSMVLKLILNFSLIPIDGIYEKGALISSLICDGFVCITIFYKLKKNMNLKLNIVNNIFKVTLISIISIYSGKFLFMNFYFNEKIKFLLEIFLIVIIYFVLSIVFNIFSQMELNIASKDLKISKKLKNVENS